jgi:hypothetical protein
MIEYYFMNHTVNNVKRNEVTEILCQAMNFPPKSIRIFTNRNVGHSDSL